MRVKAKGVLLAFVLLLVPVMLMSSTWGKVKGRVKGPNGEVADGATVVLIDQGGNITDYWATTDATGIYVISSVPPGLYTVQASHILYGEQNVPGVRVIANKSSTQNIQFGKTQVTTVTEVEVVDTMIRELITKDPDEGKWYGKTDIEQRSGDDLGVLLAAQPGANETSGLSGGLHFQGGRSNEVLYVVDGINANDPVTGGQGSYIDNAAIQEMTINTGNFNAEYGDAMSAVINIITREGRDQFEGGAEYVTDAHLRLSKDPLKYPNEDMWYNKVSVSLGGPMGIPRSSFFVSGNILENEHRFPFNDHHRKNGTLKLAWRPFQTRSPKFTLSGNYSDEWRHSYIHSLSKGIWNTMGPRQDKDNYQLNLKISHPVNNNFTYNINVGTFNTHTKTAYMDGADYNDFRMIGRSQMPWVGWAYNQTWWEHLDEPDTVISDDGDTTVVDSVFRRLFDADSMKFDFSSDSTFPVIDNGDTTWINVLERYANITSNADSAVWFYYNEYVVDYGYYVEGDNTFYWRDWETQLEALNERWYEINEWRPTIDSATGDTIGLNYHHFDLELYKYYYKLWTQDTLDDSPYEDSLESSGNMYLVRYNRDPLFRRFAYYFTPYWSERNTTKYIADAAVELNNDVHWMKAGVSFNYHQLDYEMIQFVNENPYNDSYHKEPIIAAAYVQDKIEYEDLILNVGLRFDFFEPASDFFIDPENIDVGTAPADPKFQLSPRFSISFAVSEKALMFASYGHFFQPVDLQSLYENLEGDITVGVPLLGNPDLPPLKTIFYQAGYKYALGPKMALDIKAYYKDQENLLATRSVTTIYKKKLASYTIYVLEDFAKIKGFDVGLVKLAGGDMLSGNVTYSFMDAKGTGSSGREFYYNYRGSGFQPPKHEYPLEFDITHSVKTNLNLYVPHDLEWRPAFLGVILSRVNINAQFNLASGRPYFATDSRGTPVPLGTRRMPATSTVDLKLDKRIPIGRGQKVWLGFYVDVQNLLDEENVRGVYTNTGLPDDPGGQPVFEASNYRNYEANGFASEYEMYQADLADWQRYYAQNPGNYDTPRIMHFGVRVSF